jgi:hypothetical protein
MPRIIRDTAEKLRKLGDRLGDLADRVLGQPTPKLIPIPVPAKSRSKGPVRR